MRRLPDQPPGEPQDLMALLEMLQAQSLGQPSVAGSMAQSANDISSMLVKKKLMAGMTNA